ncbi:MAG: gamma-glutamylcyclotransferase family protein [Solirubrobacteraceae bacterium]
MAGRGMMGAVVDERAELGDFVFGYGSLVGEHSGAAPAVLRGWRRVWGVAMDNTVDIPGYKRYLAPDGSRPDVCVAFLDIEPDPDASVTGVVLEAELAQLDRREHNYDRVDVTAGVVDPPGRVWAYAGRSDSRERLRDARADGRAVIAAAYARSVADLLAPDLPVRELRLVPIPTADGRHPTSLRSEVIDGRKWRATNPELPEDERGRLGESGPKW